MVVVETMMALVIIGILSAMYMIKCVQLVHLVGSAFQGAILTKNSLK